MYKCTLYCLQTGSLPVNTERQTDSTADYKAERVYSTYSYTSAQNTEKLLLFTGIMIKEGMRIVTVHSSIPNLATHLQVRLFNIDLVEIIDNFDNQENSWIQYNGGKPGPFPTTGRDHNRKN